MDIIFFDLDGTLLNKSSKLSTFTKEVLLSLNENGIANTVATGRTLISARQVLDGHPFSHTQIYSNGVAIWDPEKESLSLENVLNKQEIETVLDFAESEHITPFLNTVAPDTPNQHHTIFHADPTTKIEERLVAHYFKNSEASLSSLATFSFDKLVTNISMIGQTERIQRIADLINEQDSLIAYSGPAIEGDDYYWMDIHHRLANKGSAVMALKEKVGAQNVICFGDSQNDISMFKCADECYAPSNAKPYIKDLATDIIGHHDEDGVSKFLVERFSL